MCVCVCVCIKVYKQQAGTFTVLFSKYLKCSLCARICSERLELFFICSSFNTETDVITPILRILFWDTVGKSFVGKLLAYSHTAGMRQAWVLKADCLAVVSKHRTVICRNLACISHFRSNFVLAHAVLAKEHHTCPYMLSTPYDLPCRGLYRSYICVAIEICWWYGIIKLFCISLWELNQVGCFVWKSSSEFFLPVPWSVHSTEPIPAALI